MICDVDMAPFGQKRALNPLERIRFLIALKQPRATLLELSTKAYRR